MALRALQGPAGGSAPVGGSGNPNTIPRWTGPTTLGDSILTQSGTTIVGSTMTGFGIGTTVSPWGAGRYALQVGGSPTSNIVGGSPNTVFGSNQYHDGTDARYINNGFAATYVQSAGEHRWSTAASGTAGAVATLTQYMVINSSGNVGIGTASPTWKNHTVGAGNLMSGTTYNLAAVNQDQTTFRGVSFGYDSSGQIGTIAATTAGNASNLAFWTFSGTAWFERARIDSAGRMCIGTTTATTGRALTTVADLDVFGVRVGRGAGSVVSNTAVGASALDAGTSGVQNVAIGNEALKAISTAGYSTAVGARALVAATNGVNVAVGYEAGSNVTTGSSNIILGVQATTAAATDSNQCVLGSATYWVATNGGATTYYATAGALLGYMQIRLNGANVKIPVYAP